MDEEITIINEKTRNEKIKSFLIDNRKLLISIIALFILIVLGPGRDFLALNLDP